ncbi:MAG: DMT family transporter [Lachnospiraceae bacterium]|nr:DMT family transporter [Lachnospiraceae bacterium]MDD3614597.1 DMT family transporter [Lachnospiraceae bacterium]
MNPNLSRRSKGILCILSSAFFFALMNVLVRLSGDLPSIEKSFFRNLVAMVFAFFVIRRNKIPLEYKRKDMKYFLIRSVCGMVGILGNFYALDHMMVADASMLNKLSPFFAIIFSFIILREKVKPIQICCVGIAFAGTLFIIKPGFSGVSMIPALAGILGGMGAGIAYTYVRVLGNRGVKGPLIVFFFSAFSTILNIPLMLPVLEPMSMQQFLILLGAGAAAAGGQFSITAAYTYAPAREISIFDYSQIIFATLLSFFLLGQIPDHYSFVGYIIICGASAFMFFYNKRCESKNI